MAGISFERVERKRGRSMESAAGLGSRHVHREGWRWEKLQVALFEVPADEITAINDASHAVLPLK
jgi:hypothetical protein